MSTSLHKDLLPAEVHSPISFEYTDATTREAATGMLPADVGKFAKQLDDNSVWMLADDSPVTWTLVGGGGLVTHHATAHVPEGDDPIAVGTPVDVSTENEVGDAHTLAVSNHQHALPFSTVQTVLGAATGAVDFNDQNITGVGTVDGVTVSAHAARHAPGGLDGLSVGTPSNVGTANAEGSSSDLVRKDHVHNLPLSVVKGLLGAEAGLNAGWVFKSDGAGSGTMQKNSQSIFNYLTVGKSGDVNYNTIKAAVTAAVAGGATASNPYMIQVHPGSYTEDPMTVPAGVNIVSAVNRIDTVFVVASDPLSDLFTCTGGYFGGINASGVTDVTKCLFRIATNYTLTAMHGISLRNCSNGIILSGGAALVLTLYSTVINGASQGVGTAITATGAGTYLVINGGFFSVPAVLLPYYAINPIQTAVKVDQGAKAYLVTMALRLAHKDDTCIGIQVDNGAYMTLMSSEATGCAKVVNIGAGGTGTKAVVQASTLLDNHTNFRSESATGVFLVDCSVDEENLDLVFGAILSGQLNRLNDSAMALVGELKYRFSTGREADMPDFIYDYTATGPCAGGEVSAGTGLHVDVAAGEGWIRRLTDEDSTWYEWDAVTALDLTASATNYVYFDGAAEGIVASVSSPGDSNILLATVVTDGSGIRFLHQTRTPVEALHNLLQTYFLYTRKFALKSGLAVSQGTTVRKIDIASGAYFRAYDTISYAGSSGDATFSYFYNGGATEIAAQTQLNITQYDLSGTLTALTAGYRRVDTVYLTSDGRISVVMGTAQYSTKPLAELAPLGTAPSFISETACKLARVIVLEGSGIEEILDERPQPGLTTGGGSSSGVTVHSQLSGLSADDHTQYLLAAGSRSMSGGLNMGGNHITNVGNVDGVDVSAHASRHNPGGADAVTVATPTAVLVAAAAAEGSAASLARSDHQHGVAAAAPSTVGTANAEGNASSVARSNHVHDHGAQTAGTLHAVATGSVAGFESAADKTKLDGIASGATNTPLTSTVPVNVTKATADAGTAVQASRQDHKHDVTTATAGTAAIGDTAAEGSATSLARSDHRHAITAATPVSVGTANAAGSATTHPRSDHVHSGLTRDADDISTFTEKTTPVAADLILIEDSAAAGVKKKVQAGNLPGAVAHTTNLVTASGTITTTSATPVLTTGMTLTPAAGTYLCFFTGAVWMTTADTTHWVDLYIYADGSAISGAQNRNSDSVGYAQPYVCVGVCTVNGSQAIEGRWSRIAGGGTATMIGTRTLRIVKIG